MGRAVGTPEKSKLPKEKEAKSIGFVEKALSLLNKTEAEKQSENVQSFLKKAVISTNTQIALIQTRDIPTIEMEIVELNHVIEEKKEMLEQAKYSIANSFADYVFRLNSKEEEIEFLEDRLARKEGSLTEANEKIEKFKKMLEYLR